MTGRRMRLGHDELKERYGASRAVDSTWHAGAVKLGGLLGRRRTDNGSA